ncbi:hypothetical protein CRG98_026777 [Punica granatum]|uniref:Uncharacterized protein n=1 Tax=Punica granatum TaxID=22663 RepID=A0A2I0J9C1_PUNGR|nr:hypothetical protein CRG98_026777 [Punica granatum]
MAFDSGRIIGPKEAAVLCPELFNAKSKLYPSFGNERNGEFLSSPTRGAVGEITRSRYATQTAAVGLLHYTTDAEAREQNRARPIRLSRPIKEPWGHCGR